MWKCSFKVFFSLLCFKGFVLKYLVIFMRQAKLRAGAKG